MLFRASIDLALEPMAAFDEFVAELSQALTRVGMRLEPRKDGRISEGKVEVGRVLSWRPGKKCCLSGARPTGSLTRLRRWG